MWYYNITTMIGWVRVLTLLLLLLQATLTNLSRRVDDITRDYAHTSLYYYYNRIIRSKVVRLRDMWDENISYNNIILYIIYPRRNIRIAGLYIIIYLNARLTNLEILIGADATRNLRILYCVSFLYVSV
jgi:hypothetical protein